MLKLLFLSLYAKFCKIFPKYEATRFTNNVLSLIFNYAKFSYTRILFKNRMLAKFAFLYYAKFLLGPKILIKLFFNTITKSFWLISLIRNKNSHNVIKANLSRQQFCNIFNYKDFC